MKKYQASSAAPKPETKKNKKRGAAPLVLGGGLIIRDESDLLPDSKSRKKPSKTELRALALADDLLDDEDADFVEGDDEENGPVLTDVAPELLEEFKRQRKAEKEMSKNERDTRNPFLQGQQGVASSSRRRDEDGDMDIDLDAVPRRPARDEDGDVDMDDLPRGAGGVKREPRSPQLSSSSRSLGVKREPSASPPRRRTEAVGPDDLRVDRRVVDG